MNEYIKLIVFVVQTLYTARLSYDDFVAVYQYHASLLYETLSYEDPSALCRF